METIVEFLNSKIKKSNNVYYQFGDGFGTYIVDQADLPLLVATNQFFRTQYNSGNFKLLTEQEKDKIYLDLISKYGLPR